jgi:hypothetical protein
MRRWIYALTISQVALTLAVVIALVGMYGEVTSLRRQVRTGSSMESLAAPTAQMPSMALPTSGAPAGLSAQVVGMTNDSGQISLDVLVQSGSPVDLFGAAPLLSDASGKAYPASTDSRQKAALAALSLGENGSARFTLSFTVPPDFRPVTLIFNNASASTVQPQLRAEVR